MARKSISNLSTSIPQDQLTDNYGYEVFVGCPWAPMLDCNPDWYGLTAAEARLLYDAILSCVVGTCGYANKLAMRHKALGGAA